MDLETLPEQAKKLASRKLLRFLDAASTAPFVVAATLYHRAPLVPPADVALYTVGGWDGDMPDQPFTPDGSVEADAALSRSILEDANPVIWLRMLSNNALCQVSISEGFRGPNAHLVGGPETVGHALAAAAADIAGGAARQALVVAYDTRPEHRHHPSGRAPTRAAGLSLVEATGDDDLLPRLLACVDEASATAASALDLMIRCVVELGLPSVAGSPAQ
jgi:hypothetical protein